MFSRLTVTDRDPPPGVQVRAETLGAHRVGGEFIPMDSDLKINPAAKQRRIVDRRITGAVGEKRTLLTVVNSTSGTPRPLCESTTRIPNGRSGDCSARAVRRIGGWRCLPQVETRWLLERFGRELSYSCDTTFTVRTRG